mmetsp:Transcript_6551/g.20645  ORF Transcript_6551/g.20645 Transcript_6551/m.20645 type:complete len:252 (+) Transcript_6551:630-1385(+)
MGGESSRRSACSSKDTRSEPANAGDAYGSPRGVCAENSRPSNERDDVADASGVARIDVSGDARGDATTRPAPGDNAATCARRSTSSASRSASAADMPSSFSVSAESAPATPSTDACVASCAFRSSTFCCVEAFAAASTLSPHASTLPPTSSTASPTSATRFDSRVSAFSAASCARASIASASCCWRAAMSWSDSSTTSVSSLTMLMVDVKTPLRNGRASRSFSRFFKQSATFFGQPWRSFVHTMPLIVSGP